MKRWILLVALFVMMAEPGVMQAAPLYQTSTLDQANEVDAGVGYGESLPQTQTFTAGRTGALDRVELYAANGSDRGQVPIQITAVDGDGNPTGPALGSGSFNAADVAVYPPIWISVSIDPAVQVVAGVQYAIVKPQTSASMFTWGNSRNDTYPRGKSNYSSGTDYLFRTYVLTPSTVPTCQDHDATIYVKDGTIVGGPDNGKTYKGLLIGTTGDDVIVGTDGSDIIFGGSGADTICAGAGADVVDAGAGNDRIDGGAGTDALVGGSGDDVIDGGSGKDALEGGPGNDTLTGGSGTDAFDGGPGTDTVTDRAPNEPQINVP